MLAVTVPLLAGPCSNSIGLEMSSWVLKSPKSQYNMVSSPAEFLRTRTVGFGDVESPPKIFLGWSDTCNPESRVS